eukprot:GILK01000818.1.p1 GENE.GILK01000818.1~~GILK01000818.1.p1  ORF type:complete len:578 (+),score=69.61 GILK01000818.1:89-1822(+)
MTTKNPAASTSSSKLEVESSTMLPQDPDARMRKWTFAAIFVINILVNYDSGAVPATLDQIKTEFDLSTTEQGLLGALPYVGLTAISTVSGYCLQTYSAKKITAISLISNMIAGSAFAMAPEKFTLFASRLITGVTQASVIIYAPVWVDEFAPEASRTTWLGGLQAAVGLGVMVGYTVAGFVASWFSWRVSLWIQVICLAPFTIGNILIPASYIDSKQNIARRTTVLNSTDRTSNVSIRSTDSRRSRIDSIWQPQSADGQNAINVHPRMTVMRQLKIIAKCKVYIWTVVALCALFFVVTGIQFWITEFLTTYLKTDKNVVLGAFAIVCATGPTAGVFFGGWFVDRLGGYKGVQGTLVTIKCCVLFGVLACCFGIPAGFIRSFPPVITLVWLLLFFGGAILPAATGVLMSAVPVFMRSFSSAVSMLTYNTLGYAAGAFLPGVVMDASEDASEGIANGFRLILFWALWGVVGMAVSHHYAKAAMDAYEAKEGKLPSDAVVVGLDTPTLDGKMGLTGPGRQSLKYVQLSSSQFEIGDESGLNGLSEEAEADESGQSPVASPTATQSWGQLESIVVRKQSGI